MARTKDMTLLPWEDCWLRERQSDWGGFVNMEKEDRRRPLLNLAPLAGRGRRAAPGEGVPDQPRSRIVERAPHPDPLRASFARLDPAKSGARERRASASVSLTRPIGAGDGVAAERRDIA